MADFPAGFEKLPGRSPENARAALDKATKNGFAEADVRTVRDGYLIPYSEADAPAPAEPADEPADEPTGDTPDIDSFKVAELDDFIEKNGLDVDTSLNKADKAAAIKAALENKE